MSFAQEGSWTSQTVTTNAAATTVVPTFLGGGAELLIVPLTIDTSNGCTGATIAHTNLTPGATYVGLSANGYLNLLAWGTWNGAASSPSIAVSYTGGNTGATGGKAAVGVFTGYDPNIIASPGPFGTGNGTSTSASCNVGGVRAGSLIVAWANNTGAKTFSAGSGYTLIFNTSPWSGNVTGYEQTTGLSEPGGTTTVSMTLASAAWNMMAVAFPAPLVTQATPPPLAGRCTYILP
jgi:hypothetical protein